MAPIRRGKIKRDGSAATGLVMSRGCTREGQNQHDGYREVATTTWPPHHKTNSQGGTPQRELFKTAASSKQDSARPNGRTLEGHATQA